MDMKPVHTFPAALTLCALLTSCGGAAPEPSSAPTSAPASMATASTTRSAAPADRQPALRDLPRGDAPALPYVDRASWVNPDGSRLPIRADHGISDVAPYHGGWLVADTRFFEGTVGLALIDNEGDVVDEWCSSGGPVTSGNVNVGGNPNLALLTSTASTIVSNPMTLAIVAAVAIVGFIVWRKYK